jgi:anaerobic selenocysteine-containing dehydrogenase
MRETSYATCFLCEACCGIEVTHENNRLLGVRGDKADPFSRGHVCPKASAIVDVQHDPDRRTRPLKRVGSEWVEIAWDTAFDEIAERIARIQQRHGNDAVAYYRGNPLVHSYGATLFGTYLAKALRTPNRYSAGSVDTWPRLLTSLLMYGAQTTLPIPDLDRTQYLLVIGANPLVSNGSVMTAPDCARRLRAIRERGGKIVVIDPRRTETAEVADEHHFITPETDALFLLALLHVVFENGLESLGRLSEYVEGRERVREIAREYSPERVADRVGIDATVLRRLAAEFAASPAAVCYGRIGICTQRFGTLASWLVDVLNIVTGNLDRPGGAMFASPAVDLGKLAARLGRRGSYDRRRSRVSRLPEYDGEFPSIALAEEIETPGKGQIRALITQAGNPVLSVPNGRRLEAALEKLELLVGIDLYVNETTRHAHYLLPPTWGLEHDMYPVVFTALAVRNFVKYSPPVVAPAEDSRHEWEIQLELATRLALERGGFRAGLRARAIRAVMRRFGPEGVLGLLLRTSAYRGLSLGKLLRNPHGLDLGSLVPRLPDLIARPGRRIDLAPEKLTQDLARLQAELASARPAALRVIGRRQLRSNNSWMHNSRRLVKGPERCSLIMHPRDAERLGISAGQRVRVASRVGAIEVNATVSDEIMPGVVSLPHGWGHHRTGVELSVARERPGESLNDILDERLFDAPSGTASLGGMEVSVTPC